jgi:hypothetical protein
MDAPALLPLSTNYTIEAGRHFVPIDANGAARRRQDEAEGLLCNLQRSATHFRHRRRTTGREMRPHAWIERTSFFLKLLTAATLGGQTLESHPLFC